MRARSAARCPCASLSHGLELRCCDLKAQERPLGAPPTGRCLEATFQQNIIGPETAESHVIRNGV